MKILTSFIAMLLSTNNLFAKNTTEAIIQVTSAVTVSRDIDYTITGTTPFATTGSVDILYPEHSVVIIKSVKPSVVLSTWINHIYINGMKAVDGTNCQVKMYNRGTIIFPYGSDLCPLACYTETDFKGDSCHDYSEGSNGGYMKTLTSATLLNKICSFKLKRGYMVTFALGTDGWGYSRVFIADQADLEINMPSNMNARVSSYRLFKWHNTHKAGLASDGNYTDNSVINSCWCYDWAQGNASNMPDIEWVPNHIYEDYPSSATCGSVTGSCHMKTNNEPGNSADDHPQTVDVVLDNWQNLMRTGMRLCSESSHDGSWAHLRTFIDSIDARGWRCDLLDLHCYWGAGSFDDFSYYYNTYGNRPIWISEWVWGASWNSSNWSSGGIFAQAPDGTNSFSTANQQTCKNGTVPIIEKLNASQYVERYAYWNNEAIASRIYYNGELSLLGKYYATMDEGLGYNASIQKVPDVVYLRPTNLNGTYTKSSGSFYMCWNDANGDMLDSMVIECKRPGESNYTWLSKISLKDMNSKSGATYTYTDFPEAGASYYRIASYPIGNTTAKYSNIISVTVGSANGDETIQYGIIDITNLDAISIDFNTELASTPAIITGLYTIKNSTTTPVSLISSVTSKTFTYQMLPWVKSGTQTVTTAEQVPFLAIQYGNYTYGNSDVEVGSAKVKADTTQVTFTKAFPEGVVPVVIADLKPSLKSNPINIRIWDVTNTGFKATAFYETGLLKKLGVQQTMSYLACTPGQGKINSGLLISAGIGENPAYGTTYRPEVFRKTDIDGTISEGADTLYLENPYIFGALQTYNYPTATVTRRYIDMVVNNDKGTNLTYGTRIKRIVDTSGSTYTNNLASADKFGWICLSTITTTYLVEDVNKNGVVDTQDVLKVYEYIQTSTGYDFGAIEDVNKDGVVDTQDILQIYKYIQNN